MWNTINPEQAVSVGDRVLEVNGLRGTQFILGECEEHRMLKIVFSRCYHSRRSPTRIGTASRSRPVSPLQSPRDSVRQVTVSSVDSPVSLPPRHLGANTCPQKPELCSLSAQSIQHVRAGNSSNDLGAKTAPLINEALQHADAMSKLNLHGLLAVPSIDGLGHLPSPLDMVHMHGQDGARQVAESLVKRVVAERSLTKEIDLACRLQAQREVAELTSQCRAAQRHVAGRKRSDPLEDQKRSSLRDPWEPLSDIPAQGDLPRCKVQVDVSKSMWSSDECLSSPVDTSLPRLGSFTQRHDKDENGSDSSSEIANRPGLPPAVDSSPSRGSNASSWAGLPLPASPDLSPSRRARQKSTERASIETIVPVDESLFRRPVVVQPPSSPLPKTYRSTSLDAAAVAAAGATIPPKLASMFDSLQKWAVEGEMSVSEKWAAFMEGKLQIQDFKLRIRALQRATHGSQNEQRDLVQRQRQLKEKWSDEVYKTAGMRRQVSTLQEQIRAERRKLQRPVTAGAIHQAAPGGAAAAYSTEDVNPLENAEALREAQALLSEITLNVVKTKLQVRRDEEGEAEDEAGRKTPDRVVSEPNLSIILPGVSARSDANRGVDWVKRASFSDLGTPSEANRAKDEDKVSLVVTQDLAALPEGEASAEKIRSAAVAIDDMSGCVTGTQRASESSSFAVSTTWSLNLDRLRSYLDGTKDGEFNAFNECRQGPKAQEPFSMRKMTTSIRSRPERTMTFDSKPSYATEMTMGTKTWSKETALELLDSKSMLLEGIVGALVALPKLLASPAPEPVASRLEEVKAGNAMSWSMSELSVAHQARLLRDGVALNAVDPAELAAYLGKERCHDLREAYSAQWVAGWLNSYLEYRQDKYAHAPEEQKATWFRKGQEVFVRQCGRVLIDGMRSFFGRAIKLVGVEQEAMIRLVEAFARELCLDPTIQSRFQYVVAEKPKDVESLEQAVFLLTYNALILNTATHNPQARGKAQTKKEFAEQSRSVSGFRTEFCEKMWDLVKREPLG
jgi:hypothetical protein